MGISVKLPYLAKILRSKKPSQKVTATSLAVELPEIDRGELFWQLACIGDRGENKRFAGILVDLLAELSDDHDIEASYCLILGQIAEESHDFGGALKRYSEGLSLAPSVKWLRYFLHNNSGFCLNLQGRHAEAESHLRCAIEIDAERGNALKNLGVCLQAQGNAVGAAWAFAEAAEAPLPDLAALRLLEKLIEDYPQISSDSPWVLEKLEAGRKAFDKLLGE